MAGHTIEYHRAQIRYLLGFREPTVADSTALTAWLDGQVGAQDRHPDRLKLALLDPALFQVPPGWQVVDSNFSARPSKS